MPGEEQMKISLKEKLFMFLRKSPVKQIQKAGDLLEQVDFPVKLMELEAHPI